MFHDILVNQKQQSNQLTIDYADMTSSEFELIIVYMYTGLMCFDTVEQLCYGIYAAERFDLQDVKSKCLKRLQKCLNEGYIKTLKVFPLHDRFKTCTEDTPTYTLCEDIVTQHYKQILACDQLVDVDTDCMSRLLSMNSQHDIQEIEVFRALLKWIRATCVKKGVETNPEELKSVGGDLIYLVRYTLIPVELLGKEVAPSGVLSESCIATLFQKVFNDAVDVPFCTEPRHAIKELGATAAVSTTSVNNIERQ